MKIRVVKAVVFLFLFTLVLSHQACGIGGESEGSLSNLSSSSTGSNTGSTTGGTTLESDEFIRVTQTNLDSQTGSVACPAGYQLSGCTALCGNSYWAGGVYPDGNLCRGKCDSSGDQLTITSFCAKNKAGREVNVVTAGGQSGATVVCPSGQQLLGCAALCQNARPGGSVLVGNYGCQILCNEVDNGVNVAAFCLAEAERTVTFQKGTVVGGGSVSCHSGSFLAGGGGLCSGPTPGGLTVSGQSITATCSSAVNANIFAGCIQ